MNYPPQLEVTPPEEGWGPLSEGYVDEACIAAASSAEGRAVSMVVNPALVSSSTKFMQKQPRWAMTWPDGLDWPELESSPNVRSWNWPWTVPRG